MGLIMHKGVAYGGGGSDIEPNPSGTATEDLTKLGIDDTNYNVADADYRSDQKTYTFKVYDTNTHKYGSSSVSSTTTIRGVISAISALFDSVKTAINDHADVFTTINTAISSINTALSGKADTTNATYTKLTGSGHRFGDIDISQSAPFTSSDVSTIENANMAKIKTIVNNLADYAEENAGDVASIQTATGNPLTLTDAAPINAEKLEVVLEPKQDLHGQSYPYVGGAGKNKFDSDTAYASYKQSDGSYRMTGADVNGIYNYVPSNLVGKQLTFSAYLDCSKETAPNYVRIFADVNGQSVIGTSVYNGNKGYASVTFTPQSTSDYFKFTYGSNGGNYFTMSELQLEEGSARTSFSPYSNICPISGYDSVSVDGVGFNQWDEEWESGMITDSDGQNADNANYRRSKNYIPIFIGKQYYATIPSNKYGTVKFYFYKADKTYISSAQQATGEITLPNDTCYIRFRANTTLDYGNDICINISKPTGTPKNGDYLPYQSTTASITFGQTVYGGKSDFVEGGTSSKYVLKKISDLSWTYRTMSGVEGYVFQSSNVSGIKAGQSPVMASCYRIKTNRSDIDGDAQVAISNNASNTYDCVIKDDTYTDATTFVNARGDETLLFELAEYDSVSTPASPLTLLNGTNNLSSDGTSMTIGYQPDNVIGELKGEIEKCSPNPEFMHFEVNGNVVDAIPIIFDEATHSYTVSGDNWKDKTFLCVECCDMRYGILQRVLSSDMAFVDSCGKALLLYPYIRSIEQYIKISILLGQSYGYEISYQTTNTSSLTDYLKIRVRLFN